MNNKTRKILSVVLIVALMLSLSTVGAFASSDSMWAGGRIKNGASDSYTFTLDSKSEVTMAFDGTCTPFPVDQNGNTWYIDGTFGGFRATILNSSGSVVYSSPNTSGFNCTVGTGEDFSLSTTLDKGTYTFVIKQIELNGNNVTGYSMNLSWDTIQESTPSTNNGNSGNTNSGSTTTTSPSTNNSAVTKPSTGNSTVTNNSSTATNNSTVTNNSSTTQDEAVKEEATGTLAEMNTAVTDGKTYEVKTNTATVVFDNEALKTLVKNAGEVKDVTVEVKEVKVVNLSTEQVKALENVVVAKCISAEVLADGNVISKDFGGGKATVSIPFELPEGANAEDYVVVYVSEDGTLEVKETTYKDGYMVVELDHFSTYAIVEADTLPDTLELDKTPISTGMLVILVLLAVVIVGGGVVIYKKKK